MKTFVEKKYQGEVWMPGKKEKKCFCILTIEEDEVLLETALHEKNNELKINELQGVFNGLGVLTFINNRIRKHGAYYLVSRVYSPEFTFISSDHFINGRTLKMSEFYVENSAIIDWYSQINFLYNSEGDGIERVKEDLFRTFEIGTENLKVEIETKQQIKSEPKGTNVLNYGKIHFTSGTSLTLYEAQIIYNKFQKFLHFFHGNSRQFRQFNFRCLGCNEWKQVYYRNKLNGKRSGNFLSFRYSEISSDLGNIFQEWFTNQKLIECIDIILENQLSIKISHSRKFMNSVFALEALYKRFSDNRHKKLNHILLVYKELFMEILNKTTEEFEAYAKKILVARDHLVHSNIKQKAPFSEFELLYVSILLDFIMAIEILKLLKCSDENIQKVKMWAENAYHHQQQMNLLLNQNIILK